MGQPAEKVLNADAMANADSIAWFVAFGKKRASTSP
jgi:hypothetical protein